MCSFTMNFITWSSVIDDCAMMLIGMSTDIKIAMMNLFIMKNLFLFGFLMYFMLELFPLTMLMNVLAMMLASRASDLRFR